jgi:alpha-1,3-rhamnosyl/mannosyltransferase
MMVEADLAILSTQQRRSLQLTAGCWRRRMISMRIIINRLPALGHPTGIGHYAAQLVRCLREQTSPGTVHVFPHQLTNYAHLAYLHLRHKMEAKRDEDVHPADHLTVPGRIAPSRMRRYGQTLITSYFRIMCRLRRFDLYHEPNFIPMPCGFPTVATVADLSVVLHPEWHPLDRVLHFERNFRAGLARCRHFLAISEAGRQEVIRLFGIPPERVTRTYMGIRPGMAPLPDTEVKMALQRLGLPPRYLLYLGTIEPRKNLLRLLRLYCSLPAPLRERWPLVMVGRWGWNTREVADYLHSEARHRGVMHLGYVSEKYLAPLYNGARALLFPSLYEGFGLPPIEMMACGGAVLASTAQALVETVGGQAHLIDAEDDDGWRTALLRVVQDDDWWQTLRQGAVEMAQPYTWENCARQTLEVYRLVCGLPLELTEAEDKSDRRRAA